MAQNFNFTPISDAQIASGKATNADVLLDLKNNQENIRDRVCSIDSSLSTQIIFDFSIVGEIENYNINELQYLGYYPVPVNMTISLVRIRLLSYKGENSSAGGKTVGDVLKASFDVDGNITGWTSVFVNGGQPTIDNGVYAEGATSTDVQFVNQGTETSSANVIAGDVLRFDVIQKKDIQNSIAVECFGTVSTTT